MSSKCLAIEEKEDVMKRLDSIKGSDRWILSSGTVVEHVLKKPIEDSKYEHPVHSLIIDTGDSLRKKYFSAKDLDEVK